MKKLTYFILLALLLAACARRAGGELAPDADPANLPQLAGEYALNGFDINGAEYGGRLTITQRDDGAYLLQWLVSESIQEGIGQVNGNQLEVSWSTVEGFPNPMHGSAVYTITEAGELYGTKTIDGFEGGASETAYPNTPENMSG